MEYHEIAYAVMLRLFFRNFTHDKIRETMWRHSWIMFILNYAFRTSYLFSYHILRV
jgi:hypothetical protein